MKGNSLKGSHLRVLQLLFLIVVGIVHGDRFDAVKEEVRPGSCPTYPSKAKFQSSKFNGTWFAAHQFQTRHRFIECQELNFTSVKENENSFTIEGSARVNPGMSIETDGESHAVNASNPAYMRWTWKFFPSFVDHVTVLDTDYDNYAVIILCNDYGLLHAVYPILMTRVAPLEVTDEYQATIDKAKKIIPFPVYSRWNWMQICWLQKEYADRKVNPLDIDKSMKGFTDFVSALNS